MDCSLPMEVDGGGEGGPVLGSSGECGCGGSDPMVWSGESDASLATENDRSLVEEFEALPQHDVALAGAAEGRLNRFANVLPAAQTLVRLGSNGYVNANHVRLGVTSYIATQGPLPETTAAFWTMVYEQDSPVIVMLTNLVERNKVRCHRYWPKASETKRFPGGLTVRLVKSATLPGVMLRKVALSDGSGRERHVTNVQLTEWPDFGVPQSTEGVRTVLDIMDYYRATSGASGPPVVHCSAGIGRTGSFIAIHASLWQLRSTGRCNVRETVVAMRQQRPGSVQTSEQYLFVFRALKDVLFSMNAQNLGLLDSSGEESASTSAVDFDKAAMELLSGRHCLPRELTVPVPSSPFIGDVR